MPAYWAAAFLSAVVASQAQTVQANCTEGSDGLRSLIWHVQRYVDVTQRAACSVWVWMQDDARHPASRGETAALHGPITAILHQLSGLRALPNCLSFRPLVKQYPLSASMAPGSFPALSQQAFGRHLATERDSDFLIQSLFQKVTRTDHTHPATISPVTAKYIT